MSEGCERLVQYRAVAQKLFDHLLSRLDQDTGYPDPPSWGYAFSLLVAVEMNGGRFSPMAERLALLLARQDQNHPEFPWEFIVYAVQRAKRILGNRISLPCDVHRSRGTRMFNWYLLRQLNREWFGQGGRRVLFALRVAHALYTTPEGQIVDEFRTRSLQYHAFCLFLLSELVDQYPASAFLRTWLQRGVEYSMSKMLSDGTALWIGRGQEQVFGYGALIYALEYTHRRLVSLSESMLNLLQSRVLSFQREDGSFPLVLRRRDPELPEARFADAPLGWYGYNTLYDYQPFLAYCLWRTAQLEP